MTDEVGSVQLPDACQHLLFLPKTRLLIAALRTGVVGYSIEEHEDRVHFIAPPVRAHHVCSRTDRSCTDRIILRRS